jgi:hypothetical protein
MKPRSAFLIAATAVIGFAFVAPEASALPHWKASSGYLFHNHKKEEKTAKAQDPERMAPCVNSKNKTAESAVKKETRKRRPYFECKRGAPAYGRRR